ncbi:hypothetical protein [Shewanella baltica]|uniref:hypothetical protein n=1 Tax=Shewanella baltica TaxID=62322 RepID=UPI000B1F78C0|nr:hypothetical protein [Shewanella baltica]
MAKKTSSLTSKSQTEQSQKSNQFSFENRPIRESIRNRSNPIGDQASAEITAHFDSPSRVGDNSTSPKK